MDAGPQTAPPPAASDAASMLENLKMGWTGDLETAPDEWVAVMRAPYKDWADSEQRRLKEEYDRVYAAIVAEMARREIQY